MEDTQIQICSKTVLTNVSKAAKRLGVSTPHLSRVLNGKREISKSLLERMRKRNIMLVK